MEYDEFKQAEQHLEQLTDELNDCGLDFVEAVIGPARLKYVPCIKSNPFVKFDASEPKEIETIDAELVRIKPEEMIRINISENFDELKSKISELVSKVIKDKAVEEYTPKTDNIDDELLVEFYHRTKRTTNAKLIEKRPEGRLYTNKGSMFSGLMIVDNRDGTVSLACYPEFMLLVK